MVDIAWLGETLLLELALIVGGLGAFAVYMILRSHHRDRRAANALANKIRTEQNLRRKDIQKLVEKVMHEDATMAEALVAGIVRAEQDLYQAFLESYILRTHDSVDRLHSNVSEFTNSYQTLFKHSNPQAPATKNNEQNATANSTASSAADYETTIKMLETKLEVSDQALNHVFREYAAMFGVGVNAKTKLSSEEIMERLKSGELG